ncbi:MAG: aminotransferase class I/II-fold pyridoxal phosphate-dependent enzyme, partial [Alistipes sp.]|nr:aminotransferase class I/II-fold pyridoxal phosphate-dependent enzyme [Alistipes sp.]
IHCDMPLYGHKHIPFATVSDKAAACSITFGAPSKTFNIAGIVSSYAIVPNPELRQKLFSWLKANEFEMATIFAMVATEAAFTKGDDWRKQMICYIEQNIDFVDNYLKANIPQVKVIKPEASYLVWLDFSALGMEHKALVEFLINEAHLAMNDGAMFGKEGEQHMRMNVGTQRSTLERALQNLKNAIENRNNKK